MDSGCLKSTVHDAANHNKGTRTSGPGKVEQRKEGQEEDSTLPGWAQAVIIARPPSLLTVHAIKSVVYKFTTSKVVGPGLGLFSNIVPRPQVSSHRPEDYGFNRNSIFSMNSR